MKEGESGGTAPEKELEATREKLRRKSDELDALMQGARAILEEKGFDSAARAIFDHCSALIGTTSGYVALLDETGRENEVLFLESGGLPCSVDPTLPMPIRGLRAEAYRDNRVVFHNDFENSEWVKYMPEGHVALKNVMFAPLAIEGRVVGLIGLANKDGDFDEHDARIASGFGELAAVALLNSWHRDRRDRAEKERERLIQDLQSALDEVKTLQGILPVCMHCKKIRSDDRAWVQMESYISKHSEAEFSHGICPDCEKRYYSDGK